MSQKRSQEGVSENDIFVYYEDTDLSSIPNDITSLRIDSSVRVIPAAAFKDRRSLDTVEYPEGLEIIGEESFWGCESLQKMQQFPSTLVEIGNRAFFQCKQLESFGRLPLSLELIGVFAFWSCLKLQSAEIPNPTCRLGTTAFGCCKSLTYARLPEGLKFIPYGLFARCALLVDVNVPSSVIEIEDYAFFLCERLASLELLPTGLKSIGMEALVGTALKHFHFPATMKTIGTGVLADCRELESVILPPELETIPDRAFMHCSKLKEVSIPKSVTSVGNAAFSDCGLTHIDLSRCNLTSIGRNAFESCSDLKSVLLPQTGLKRIEEKTFIRCTSLTHLWIPPTVKYIGNCAFSYCTSLLSVEVPERLEVLEFVSYDVQQGNEHCGYETLVNLYLPPSDTEDVFDDYSFMDDMKLGEAADGYEDLVRKLKGRFHFLPLHKACYFQSYHTLQDNIENIQKIINVDRDACSKVDFLGMSPFHILALSLTPCLNLFQDLLSSVSSAGRVDIILRRQDIFGCTAFEYLCKNIHSTRAVDVTKSLVPSVLEPARVSFLGLDRWRDEVQSGLERVQLAEPTTLGTEVASVFQKFTKYERLEALSLLEMSVWRMKVKDENATSMDPRESCRVNCGSSIVLANVMSFLLDDVATTAVRLLHD